MLRNEGIPDLSDLIENMDDSEQCIKKAEEYYYSLRVEFLRVANEYIDCDDLERIKDYYSEKIDSPRKMNRIKNLHDLLELLDKRDILSVYSIEPLNHLWDKYMKGQGEQAKILKAHLRSTQDLIALLPSPRKSYNVYLRNTGKYFMLQLKSYWVLKYLFFVF